MNFLHPAIEQLRLCNHGRSGDAVPAMVHISAYDHVGIRVSDRERALEFYRRLGFAPDPEFTTERVAEIVTGEGVRINLIFNGVARPSAHNVLLDAAVKWPGYTHAAFVIDRLDSILEWARREGVVVTEGPVDWGRRLTCFIRDPDGNVLEFNELKKDRHGPADR